MGLICVSHKDVPLGWNIWLMGLFRDFVQPTQDESDVLWEPVFLPYELGLRAIYADKMSAKTLSRFIKVLADFHDRANLTPAQRAHVAQVIVDLTVERALKLKGN